MMERGEGSNATSSKEKRYQEWKSLTVPISYNWFTDHKFVWPSLSCRWGPQLEHGKYTNLQRLYLTEKTDSSVPNTLIITNCDVVKPRVAAAEHISQFDGEARSPSVKLHKTLLHPGQVNRIRELPQNSKIVATHTDSPVVFLWDLEAQPNRFPIPGADASRPDLMLTGHRENAEWALAMCPTEPLVLSGGKDKSVLLWSIQDSITSLGSTNWLITEDIPKLGARMAFKGHDANVRDVQFCPSSAQEFCSVGDDSCFIIWDARSDGPVKKLEKVHGAREIHCVDWNAQDMNLILTGSVDGTVRLFDYRYLTAGGIGLIHKFEGHKAPVTSIQWCPDKASVFASSAMDGILNIWDHAKVGNNKENARTKIGSTAPSGLFFQHAGHHRNENVDFHWNPHEPWTLASTAHDVDGTHHPGSYDYCTLQIWRLKDLIYRPKEVVIAELKNFKEHLMKTCVSQAKSKEPKKKFKKSSNFR